jgi:phosphohistidine phosphatase SixA
MIMKIYLIRHAERDRTLERADADQPLTRKGEGQADTLARKLQAAGDIPTLFLTSKHKHARQMAERMKIILAPNAPLVPLDSLTPVPGFKNLGSVIGELALTCPDQDPSSHAVIAIVLHHPRQTQLAIMLKGQNRSWITEPEPDNAEAICLMAASLDEFISGRAQPAGLY